MESKILSVSLFERTNPTVRGIEQRLLTSGEAATHFCIGIGPGPSLQ